jgi:hypothetical protein
VCKASRLLWSTVLIIIVVFMQLENISLKKLLKLNVNLSSCLNLFSIWNLLNFMIAILVYKYCYFFPKKVELYDYQRPFLNLIVNIWLSIIYLLCVQSVTPPLVYCIDHNCCIYATAPCGTMIG